MHLLGQVVDPVLKSSACNVVKKIEGVTRVDNQIEVLPTSGMDDGYKTCSLSGNLRQRCLSQYSMPPIDMIVKNGNVTLEGVVARTMDKQIAEMQAKGVPNVFSVTDNLQVEESKENFLKKVVGAARAANKACVSNFCWHVE